MQAASVHMYALYVFESELFIECNSIDAIETGVELPLWNNNMYI